MLADIHNGLISTLLTLEGQEAADTAGLHRGLNAEEKGTASSLRALSVLPRTDASWPELLRYVSLSLSLSLSFSLSLFPSLALPLSLSLCLPSTH